MELSNNITSDIAETLRLRKQCDDITAVLELRKKLQKIEMWRNYDARVKDRLEYKQFEVDKLYDKIGLKNQDKKKSVDVNPALIYHLS
jgi:hypothetical protein